MLKKRIWIVISVLAVLGLLIGGFGCAKKETEAPAPAPKAEPEVMSIPTPALMAIPERTVKIGFIGALSGESAPWGLAVKSLLEMYADGINQAGGLEPAIENKRIMFEVVSYDDRWVDSEALAGANKLIYEDNVEYLFMLSSSGTAAANKVVNENRIPLFTAGRKATIGTEYPYTFRYTPDGYASAFATLDFIDNNFPEYDTMSIVNRDDANGHVYTDNEAKVWDYLWHRVAETVFYEKGTTDFYPVALKALGKVPDVLSFSRSSPDDIPLMFEQAQKLGFKGLYPSAAGVTEKLKFNGHITIGTVPGDPGETTLQREAREELLSRHGQLYPQWDIEGQAIWSFFHEWIPDAGTADNNVVYETISAPGYTFDTWWGKASWSGEDIWGLDRQIDSPIPISWVLDGEWKQIGFVSQEDIRPLYDVIEIAQAE